MKKIFLISVVSMIVEIAFNQNLSSHMIFLQWELGYSPDSSAETMKWIPAAVPGAVQVDIAAAEKYPAWYYAENWKNYRWMEDRFFTYRTTFDKPSLKKGDHLFFFSKGIDYRFDILLNKEVIFQQEGMFTWVKIDMTGKLHEKNTLEIIIHPVPKSRKTPVNEKQADHSVKPAVSYGWDWHPRLIPSGIWDETGLILEPSSYIENTRMEYSLNSSLDTAAIKIRISGRNLINRKYIWKMLDAGGKEVLSKEGKFIRDEDILEAELIHPELWWPHDQGTPYLYSSSIHLLDDKGEIIQSSSQVIGFRRVRLVMNTGTLSDPEGYPKSRRLPPIQLELNGRRIFCKGTNWVNPEVFPGIITQNRYNELIDRAIEANFNIFRIWGGGIINKESFYELCDKKGILVWQEFPLACNDYPDDPHYLKILEQESASIINRLKKHPCIALWCGGNELFNSWSGMDDQSLALRLLNSQCLRLDPGTPFIPTSPIQGMAHGNYVFRDWTNGEEVFTRMNKAHFTAYTEFGMPAPASVEILKSIIPPGELWPPAPGGSWESHHAYKAWAGNTWLMQEMIEDYFGKSADLAELVENGQLIQGEGYKYIFEEARRQKPYCSMALNWCYNEPWPTAANNSLISWPTIIKPGYYQVKNACRPVMASATIEKFTWTPGESFKTTVWMLNDSPEEVTSGKLTVSLVRENEKILVGIWDFGNLNPNENLRGQEFTIKMPGWTEGRIKLTLEVEGRPELNSEYILLLRD